MNGRAGLCARGLGRSLYGLRLSTSKQLSSAHHLTTTRECRGEVLEKAVLEMSGHHARDISTGHGSASALLDRGKYIMVIRSIRK